jgi:hypothetical protein
MSSNFGKSCVTGTKVLCGPGGSKVFPRWVGTAPACSASCDDCIGDTPVCMDQSNSEQNSQSFTQYFGKKCLIGTKVLCGPLGSKVFSRWIGTAPLCDASCSDCVDPTPQCMDSTSDALFTYANESQYFGASCSKGSKVLCSPPGSSIYPPHPRWIGTAPACGASCSDCPYNLPVCVDMANSAQNTLSNLFTSFGKSCITGSKVLCGPVGSEVFPRWIGTAPACGGSCSDCSGDTPVCIFLTNKDYNQQLNISAVFGKQCITGTKVLCGPPNSVILPRCIGTAPACATTCADCKGNTPVCMDQTNSQENSAAEKFAETFGESCLTGTKVLCGPVGSEVFPRWVGTAPACGGTCSDCSGDTPVCMEITGKSEFAYEKNYKFGKNCLTGSKVLCGPPSSTVYPAWIGTAPFCEGSCSDCTDPRPVCIDTTLGGVWSKNHSFNVGASCVTGAKVLCSVDGSGIQYVAAKISTLVIVSLVLLLVIIGLGFFFYKRLKSKTTSQGSAPFKSHDEVVNIEKVVQDEEIEMNTKKVANNDDIDENMKKVTKEFEKKYVNEDDDH